MSVRAHLIARAGTDMGRRRTNNEDRFYVDEERGIFAVIDGVGGHAAGEHAAAIAVEVLKERLERQSGTPEERLREAIALANNEIHAQARSRPDWTGMACVLTVAVIEEDIVTVGHVGDSRLYLLQPGRIEKITRDHSPVGEREDSGELSERDAMRHPRRNEIFRDVGSEPRTPDDPGFIEIRPFPMPSDGAILLCSDGLSDLVSSDEIRAGVERYAPDYDAAIRALIGAANQAGGKDNITVVLVAAPGYSAAGGRAAAAAAGPPRRWWLATAALVALTAGAEYWAVKGNPFAPAGPRTIVVDQDGIAAALAKAHPGDTVTIPPGRYSEQVQLRAGVVLRAQRPGTVELVSFTGDPPVVARNIPNGSLDGVSIVADRQRPATAGIEILNASPSISNVKISGAQTGLLIAGASAPVVTAARIVGNLAAGVEVGPGAKPRIDESQIAANGRGKPGPDKPGIEVLSGGHAVLRGNTIVNNAAEAIWVHGADFAPADYRENYFGDAEFSEAVRHIKPEPEGRPLEKGAPAPKRPAGRDR